MACTPLASGITINCQSEKQPGGHPDFFYVIQKEDFLSYTIDGTLKDILTLVPTANKLFKFQMKEKKNNSAVDVVKGETFDTFNHKFIPVIYSATSLEETKVENLIQSENLIFIVPTFGNSSSDARFIVLGLDLSTGLSTVSGGLKVTGGGKETGIDLQGRKHWTLTFEGEIGNSTRNFNIASGTFTTTKAYLEALL